MNMKLKSLLNKAIDQTEYLQSGTPFRLTKLFQLNYLDQHLNEDERKELELAYFIAYKNGTIKGIEFNKEYMHNRSEYIKL
ncbi:hypothetical protein [Acinetobacter modestus]|uniref:hypothetical protein n=1 Tax=Acinetobacter modestus TaxID=1776740 RepID=UPI00166B2923|nr:hypothetical protein [Acinetobacter modestus]MCG2223352.1 hypothetical protein [Staphylococcus epidermidis]GGA33076.1 hypothetical protein GCM10017554_33010 [Acinetobacter modestus]